MTDRFLAVHLAIVMICCTSDLYIMHGQYSRLLIGQSRLLIGKSYVHVVGCR